MKLFILVNIVAFARNIQFQVTQIINWLKVNTKSDRSILVMWLECRFLDTEVDGLNTGISMLCP